MLASAGVITFVPTANPQRARDFYERVLGLKFVADDHFALVFDLHGVMLRVVKLQAVAPVAFTILGWIVPDIRGAVAGLRAKSVGFERYEGLSQDDLDIWTAPDGAKVAWFKDPDGNILSLTEFSAQAKSHA